MTLNKHTNTAHNAADDAVKPFDGREHGAGPDTHTAPLAPGAGDGDQNPVAAPAKKPPSAAGKLAAGEEEEEDMAAAGGGAGRRAETPFAGLVRRTRRTAWELLAWSAGSAALAFLVREVRY